MILPNKHIKLSNSLLNAGALLLKHIDKPRTVTLLWNNVKKIPEIQSFEKFTLSLDLLFLLGLVKYKDGLLWRVT